MAKEFVDLRKEIEQMQFDLNFMQKIDCSKEDNKKYAALLKAGNPLPKDIYQNKYNDSGEYYDEFYKLESSGLTDDEKRMYMEYKKLLHIKTIKNSALFFVILTILNIVVAFFFFMGFLS